MIERPRLPEDYFRLFHTAVEKARLHGDAVICDLGKVYYPDLVAEVADRFLSMGEVKWSLAVGEYRGSLYFSVRTRDRRMNAGKMVREVIEPEGGTAGGHGSMAGARLPVKGMTQAVRSRMLRRVFRSFLREFDVEGSRARRLV
jgi:nanoRNase/pAp phosphatase (c-di-AMP/oligoRNAs hydrolase)